MIHRRVTRRDHDLIRLARARGAGRRRGIDGAETAGGPDVTNGGWISEFEHGSISWLNQGDGTFKETVTKK